jgi:NADH-quinone oxidoreductase subunit L
MFLALGLGAYEVAVFHVITHAFFKACLFLGSGSVIHALRRTRHAQNGWIEKVMTIIYYLLNSNIRNPPFSGFSRKTKSYGSI